MSSAPLYMVPIPPAQIPSQYLQYYMTPALAKRPLSSPKLLHLLLTFTLRSLPCFILSTSLRSQALQAMSTSAKTDPEEHTREEEENAPAADDEDTGAQVAPIVKLEEVAVTTGEEDEDPILDLKSKLYRFDKEGNQWKERGVGTVKLLKHKVTGKVRLVMRQSKTLKICANHLVIPTMSVQEHAGNDKSCVWHATDFADGELKDELFCIRFPSVENCKTFRETFQEVVESQGNKEESKEATAAAGLLEKLSVSESKTDAKEGEEAKEEKDAGEKSEAEAEKKEEPASST